MKYVFYCFVSFIYLPTFCMAQNKADAIIGKWVSTEKNIEVEVYKQNDEFKARVIWFDDSDDKTKPWTSRLDEKNNNKALRNKKILDIDVLHKLKYNIDGNEWQDGIIYDCRTGKEWSSKAWINSAGILKVRGYWQIPIFGQNMSFIRF